MAHTSKWSKGAAFKQTKCCVDPLRSGSNLNGFQKLKNGGDQRIQGKLRIADNNLKVIQYNSNGLSGSKRLELMHLLEVEEPDLVLIQESWLTKLQVLKIPKYHVERRDRITSRKGPGEKVKGGGVLILVRDTEESRVRYQIIPMLGLDLGDDDVTEVLQVKLLWGDNFIVFSNIYIPPIRHTIGENRIQRFNADNVLNKCIESCLISHHVLAGDINAHHPDVEHRNCGRRDRFKHS